MWRGGPVHHWRAAAVPRETAQEHGWGRDSTGDFPASERNCHRARGARRCSRAVHAANARGGGANGLTRARRQGRTPQPRGQGEGARVHAQCCLAIQCRARSLPRAAHQPATLTGEDFSGGNDVGESVCACTHPGRGPQEAACLRPRPRRGSRRESRGAGGRVAQVEGGRWQRHGTSVGNYRCGGAGGASREAHGIGGDRVTAAGGRTGATLRMAHGAQRR